MARLRAAGAARDALGDLGVEDAMAAERLDRVEQDARDELGRIELTPDEQRDVITRQGFHAERQTYQRLSDLGLLAPPVTRKLLHEVDDLIEETATTRVRPDPEQREPPRIERLWGRVVARLPEPAGEDASDLAYAEAMARRLAARRTSEALELFEQMANMDGDAVRSARRSFSALEARAQAALADLDGPSDAADGHAHARVADALTRVVAAGALDDLVSAGLLPRTVATTVGDDVARAAATRA